MKGRIWDTLVYVHHLCIFYTYLPGSMLYNSIYRSLHHVMVRRDESVPRTQSNPPRDEAFKVTGILEAPMRSREDIDNIEAAKDLCYHWASHQGMERCGKRGRGDVAGRRMEEEKEEQDEEHEEEEKKYE